MSLVVRCCLSGWHYNIVGLSQIGDACHAWVVLYEWGDDGSGGRERLVPLDALIVFLSRCFCDKLIRDSVLLTFRCVMRLRRPHTIVMNWYFIVIRFICSY